MNLRIKGTGSFLPATTFSNDDIAKLVDTNDEWIRERTGIGTRRLSTGEDVAFMAAKACENALEMAGVDAKEVELLIVATCSPEVSIPCVACQVQAEVGAENAVAFDLNAACSGFLFALNTVYAYMQAGIYKNALVVGAEGLSKLVDWSDRGTCILFGDGAGAAYVEADQKAGEPYRFVQHAIGAKGKVLQCVGRDIQNPVYTADETSKYITMDGGEVFKFAVGKIPACINELFSQTEITADDVDYFILHQANLRIITSIAKKLGQDMSKFPSNLECVGNMSSASIPVLLDDCNRKGMFQEGMRLVMSGFGAGLTYSAAMLTW